MVGINKMSQCGSQTSTGKFPLKKNFSQSEVKENYVTVPTRYSYSSLGYTPTTHGRKAGTSHHLLKNAYSDSK
jgi:hypothetical protein